MLQKCCNFMSLGGIIFEQTKVNFQVPLQDNRFVPRVLSLTLNHRFPDHTAESTAGDSSLHPLMIDDRKGSRSCNLPITSSFKRPLDHQTVKGPFINYVRNFPPISRPPSPPMFALVTNLKPPPPPSL